MVQARRTWRGRAAAHSGAAPLRSPDRLLRRLQLCGRRSSRPARRAAATAARGGPSAASRANSDGDMPRPIARPARGTVTISLSDPAMRRCLGRSAKPCPAACRCRPGSGRTSHRCVSAARIRPIDSLLQVDCGAGHRRNRGQSSALRNQGTLAATRHEGQTTRRPVSGKPGTRSGMLRSRGSGGAPTRPSIEAAEHRRGRAGSEAALPRRARPTGRGGGAPPGECPRTRGTLKNLSAQAGRREG
jgi:hypothetical protein